MGTDLKEELIKKLELHYGSFEMLVSKFGTTSFGKIANDLCISSSLFSKLIAGTATEGMYLRALENVDRLIKSKALVEENSRLTQELEELNDNSNISEKQANTHQNTKKGKFPVGVIALFTLLGIAFTSAFFLFSPKNTPTINKVNHPLSRFFDKSIDEIFDSGYLTPEDITDYCPCSAYEGKWKLKTPYKLPLPGSKKPGVYLVAKSADVRMKCSRSTTEKGTVLLGYEYLTHEIWIDKERTAISPQFFDEETMTYTDEFTNLNFEENERFEKLAVFNSFFIDRFFVYPDSIIRRGEPSGRYAEYVNEELAKAQEVDVKYLIRNVISNLTQTRCNTAVNENCDPNTLKPGSTFSFDCLYSINIENLGFGGGYPYTKTYELIEQNYADKLVCGCE